MNYHQFKKLILMESQGLDEGINQSGRISASKANELMTLTKNVTKKM